MLLLTRKPGEALIISLNPATDRATPVGELFANGPITITVLETGSGGAKIGIDADTRLLILRDELTRK